MEIRDVKIEDVDNNLLNLYIEGFKLHYNNRKDIFKNKTTEELKDDLLEVINDNDRLIIVIEDNNTIVGYASYRMSERITKALWIDAIVVDSNYRNKGYGKILMNKIQEIAENNGCSRVEFNCWSFNESALKFYEKLGFLSQRIIFEKVVDLNKNNIDK